MEWSISTAQFAALVSAAVLFVDAVRRLIRDQIERKGYPLPPGPIPLPFLGSALSLNTQQPFKTYAKWQAQYGDIMYIKILGMDVVVLNTHSVAVDLLEKRSQIYSDRPYIATIDPYGHEFDMAFARYGDHWRLRQRIFNQTFRADAVDNFHAAQLRKVRQMIESITDDPGDYQSHYMTFASGVSMNTIYDYDPRPRGDPFVSTLQNFLDATLPVLLAENSILLQKFPFLLSIPDGLPGSYIKHEVKLAREMGVKAVQGPYEYVLRRRESERDDGTTMVSKHITRLETLDPDDSYRSEYEFALKSVSFSSFAASVETTSSTLMTFTLAMVKNPRIWKRAQANLDAIVGTDRLPNFDDRPSLPYVDAVLQETLRWQPVVPTGVPHATMTSDVYNGFYIPKGATVIPNTWAMSRDASRYPNPEEFIPERFLDSKGELTDDMPHFAFGFGRRICPGRYLANGTLWIAMATMFAILDFNLAKDVDGKDVKFEAEFKTGITHHPKTFPCSLTPRPHITKASLA